ncbi:MAG: ABC transporter ATP-binding protein [Bacteroidetes bacterium]|jgi:ABC-2 type transport system ATP-binding protein|nr:ABC transporter ATP-binding protein [Bacteroidota bacterium]
MNSSVIEFAGLTKKYGSFTAVDHLNLSIDEGEIFGLLGPNGAGKSTTILMMLGLTEPTYGTVKVCGINSTTNPVEVKRKTGYLPEDVGFYDDYTGFENLIYSARLNGIPDKEAKEKVKYILDRVGLSEEINKKAGKYSRGMRQRLGLADVLIKDPSVIILDEPTLGIDPKGISEFLELILKLSREEKSTVLLSSHHLHQVQKICDRVGIFVEGKLIAEGDINTLSNKLFSSDPFHIEAAIRQDEKVGSPDIVRNELVEKIKQVAGVHYIETFNDTFRISCAEDVSGEIARVIVGSGVQLIHLSGKEYGLDDIYNRYFEQNGNSN